MMNGAFRLAGLTAAMHPSHVFLMQEWLAKSRSSRQLASVFVLLCFGLDLTYFVTAGG